MPPPYIGRFAPSPSGPLHLGSVVAALASHVDARAHGGQWLVRIEDVDLPRSVPGADQLILQQLQHLGMHADGSVLWQSHRFALYEAIFQRLRECGRVYGCACTRRELQALPAHADGERAYPGTCSHGLPPGRLARAWRVRVNSETVHFLDRWCGPQEQNLPAQIGDFVIRRADGLWAYQFAVVIDDLAQGVTHVVRGADLLSSTGRQIDLRQQLITHAADLLGLSPAVGLAPLAVPELSFLHVPLVCTADGRKLSKQNHAPAADVEHALPTLQQAWQMLGFPTLPASTVEEFHRRAAVQWRERFKD